MKKLLFFPCICIFAVLFLILPKGTEASGSYYFDQYDVRVVVNEDSTFDVTEILTYRFSGEFHRVNRGITLENKTNLDKCRQDPSLQCGGFSYLTLLGVYNEDGDEVPESELSFERTSYDYGDEMSIEWEFAPDGRNFNDELFVWEIKYRVYGGLGYFDDYDMFYWNTFPSDRSVDIEEGNFEINFPEDIDFEKEDLETFYYSEAYEFLYEYEEDDQTLYMSVEDLAPYEEFTVLLKYPKGIVDEYATLDLDLNPKEQDLWIDSYEIKGVKKSFDGIPPGEHELKFTASGYKSEEYTLSFKAGETKYLQVDLEMTPFRIMILIAAVCANVFSCFGGIGLIVFIIWNYYRKGRDIGGRKTIVPWFKPPDGISPVIVGSIKDEKVHTKDITSTIINAAVRGFIKIKEVGKKKYKLIRLKTFVAGKSKNGRRISYDNLDQTEVKILKDIFDGKEEIDTDDLKNKFYLKVPGINNEVYSEMERRKYFKSRPDKVRNKYLAIGIVMIVLGGVASGLLWMLTLFTCGPSLLIAGIVMVIVSFFMPAKTAKGTGIYEKCKGFRMFLHTAERFKMQKLTPEMFEAFLPYAMVFGVEKQWAKNFEDIYTKPPSWYEGQRPWTTFNTIYFVSSLSSMNTNVSRVISSSPRSSSSGWSGGGWSGGGGFSGGFSGGGGGGGSAGAS